MYLKFLLALSFAFTSLAQGQSFDHSHSLWSEILQKNVLVLREGEASRLNYQNVDQKKLKKYTRSLLSASKKQVESWRRENQLAYYFNLYNALTVERILKDYPLDSIRDLGSFFTSPWEEEFFTLFGEKAYLDKIEHEIVRGGDFNEPLLHFAFNCASIGCPALLNKAFVGKKLEEQLQKATKNFLSDRLRNDLKARKKTLYVSKIFDWYGEDFEKGHRGFHSLKDFFKEYADNLADTKKEKKKLLSGDYEIKFLSYDWDLNDTKTLKE